MLAGIVVLAAWAATSKPIPIPSEQLQPIQAITNQANTAIITKSADVTPTVPSEVKASVQYGHTPEDRGEKEQARMDWPAWIEALGVLLTGIFTGLLFVATYRLWNSTNRLAEGGERSSERELRAYITLPDSEIQQVNVGGYPVANINFWNTGQTPAYDFYAHMDITIGPYPLPGGVKLAPELKIENGKIQIAQASRGIVGADQTINLEERLSAQITPELLAALEAGDKAIYVYGYAGYRDIFQKYWRLDFVYFCGGAADTKRLYMLRMDEKEGGPNPMFQLDTPLVLPLTGLKAGS